MGESDRKVAVLFVDIVGSTKLYESIGDTKARQLCAKCIQKVSEITTHNNGVVVKTMGDGLMASFALPLDAYNSAVLMQECYQEHELSMTVGFHYGPVIEENDDLFGDTVNLAARVANKAKSGEILLTEETVAELPEHCRIVTRFLDRAKLKGKVEPVNIYTVLNLDVEATISLPYSSLVSSQGKNAKLVLFSDGEEFRFDKNTSQIAIGRDVQSDLVSKSPYASRHHAIIEFQRDRYVLTDQSSNGTYVVNNSAKKVYLKRESAPLLGSGIISLGDPPVEENPFNINFKTE